MADGGISVLLDPAQATSGPELASQIAAQTSGADAELGEALAAIVTEPVVTLDVELHVGARRISVPGYIGDAGAALLVPTAADPAVRELAVCDASMVPHQIARLVGLGPRPHQEESGAFLATRTAFETLVASGVAHEPAALVDELGLEEDAPPAWLASAFAADGYHWRVGAASTDRLDYRIDNTCEVVDSGPLGLWAVLPLPHDPAQLAMATATPRVVWRLLSTLLSEAPEPS
jgi:hypothetical protein